MGSSSRRVKKGGKWPRLVRAQIRDAIVLFREFRAELAFFVLVVRFGAVIFTFFHTYPGTDRHPSFSQALHGTFTLIFFDTVLPFPEGWYVQALFFVLPLFGLIAVAEGVNRFGSALISKRARDQKWQAAMASTLQGHIIVCGVGKVGFRVIKELLNFGRDVVAVEINPGNHFIDEMKSLGVPVIIADARRVEGTRQAGVEAADAVVPCTDDELTNLDIALDARELNPEIKVVMRMFDPDLAARIEKGFGIHTAFSTSALAAPIFATAATRTNVKHSFDVGETLLHISELTLEPGSKLEGWTVGGLEEEYDLSVVYCAQ